MHLLSENTVRKARWWLLKILNQYQIQRCLSGISCAGSKTIRVYSWTGFHTAAILKGQVLTSACER